MRLYEFTQRGVGLNRHRIASHDVLTNMFLPPVQRLVFFTERKTPSRSRDAMTLRRDLLTW
jgi:hypothetical protein